MEVLVVGLPSARVAGILHGPADLRGRDLALAVLLEARLRAHGPGQNISFLPRIDGLVDARRGRGPDLATHFREPYDGLCEEANDSDGEAELANLLRDAGELDLSCSQSTRVSMCRAKISRW